MGRSFWGTALLVAAVAACVPGVAGAQSIGDVFRKVNPAVVVIRAKGQDVEGPGGLTRFTETGSGVLVVRTWQGAEVIVPNAQLVTERVTNWTLSDRQRLIELPVGVSYSAHPKKVMEMLETVAHAHPHVLPQPAPRAFVMGFGDSSINFELRAWTDQFDQWFQIRSELAAAVYDAGPAAGIAFPFPQREVRLLHDAPGGSATPAQTAWQTAGTPRGSAT